MHVYKKTLKTGSAMARRLSWLQVGGNGIYVYIYIYIYRRSLGEAIQHWNTAEHCNDSVSALCLSLFEICRWQGAEYEIRNWE